VASIAAWFEAYKKDRKTRPLKPSKKFRAANSPTRRMLECIGEDAAGMRILETNISDVATPTKADLSLQNQSSATFRFLVEAIRPRMIVAHGDDAQAAVGKLKTTASILNVDHLS